MGKFMITDNMVLDIFIIQIIEGIKESSAMVNFMVKVFTMTKTTK